MATLPYNSLGYTSGGALGSLGGSGQIGGTTAGSTTAVYSPQGTATGGGGGGSWGGTTAPAPIMSYNPIMSVNKAPVAPAPVTAVSSAPARTQVATDLKELSTATAPKTVALPGEQTDAQRKAAFAAAGTTTGGTFTEGTPSTDGTVTQIAQPDLQNVEADAVTQQYMTDIKRLRTNADARTAQIIGNIETEYAGLMEQQRKQNEAYQGGVTTEGFRSGRARYAPTIQMGILNEAVSAGISALSQLQVKKQGLILQAEAARDEKDFKLMSESMSAYRESIKEERSVAQKTYENLISASQEARSQMEFNLKKKDSDFNRNIKTGESMSPALISELDALPDDASREQFLAQTASRLGLSPEVLSGQVQGYRDEKNQIVTSTIMDMARNYPDAGITQADWSSSNIQTVMDKVTKSPSWGRKTAREQAEITQTLAAAAKARYDASGAGASGGSMGQLEYYARELMANGKLPVSVGKENGDLIRAFAMELLGDEPYSSDTVLDRSTGFATNKLSAEQKSGFAAAASVFSLLKDFETYDKEIATGPVQKFTRGKLARLTNLESDERTRWNQIRENMVSQLAAARSGLAVSEPEFVRLSNLLPTEGTFDKKAATKIDQFREDLKTELRAKLAVSNAEYAGVDLRPKSEILADNSQFEE